MKEIKKEEIELLETRGIIHNSGKGYVDNAGNVVGFYRTRNKRYIEDRFVNMLTKRKRYRKFTEG